MFYSVGVNPGSVRVTSGGPTGKIIGRDWEHKGWLSDCGHPVTRRDVCHQVSCVRKCGMDCHIHQHCEKCGAIRCHGYWWRFFRVELVEVSLVDRPSSHDAGRGWLGAFPVPVSDGHMPVLRPDSPQASH